MFPHLGARDAAFGVSFSQGKTESGDACYIHRDGPVEGRRKPGLSVFRKDGDEGDLPYPQDWVRRHDEY